jgi:hypothetical protein
MKRSTLFIALLTSIMVLSLGGCQTIQTPEGRLDREKIVNTLNTAETFFNLGLNFAELRGVAPQKVQVIRINSSIAFDLVRDCLAVNLRDTKPEDLGAALLRLRVCVNDALLLCDQVGVSPPVMAEVRSQVEKVFTLLEALTGRLYAYNSAVQQVHDVLVVLAANTEG